MEVGPTTEKERVLWEMRGLLVRETARGLTVFTQPCRNLTSDGLCGIYEERPQACRDFKLGGKDCFSYRRLQRALDSHAL